MVGTQKPSLHCPHTPCTLCTYPYTPHTYPHTPHTLHTLLHLCALAPLAPLTTLHPSHPQTPCTFVPSDPLHLPFTPHTLAPNLGPVAGTYKCCLPFCECRWGDRDTSKLHYIIKVVSTFCDLALWEHKNLVYTALTPLAPTLAPLTPLAPLHPHIPAPVLTSLRSLTLCNQSCFNFL